MRTAGLLLCRESGSGANSSEFEKLQNAPLTLATLGFLGPVGQAHTEWDRVVRRALKRPMKMGDGGRSRFP